jgi:hypothetical protein
VSRMTRSMRIRRGRVSRLSEVSEEGIQLFVGAEDAILGQVIGGPDGVDALAPRLFLY